MTLTPVSAWNGASTASKSCCSVLVHSAQSETEPPMWPRAGLAVEILAGTMVAARPNSPAIVAIENILCLLAIERTLLVWDIVLPPLLSVSLMLVFLLSSLCTGLADHPTLVGSNRQWSSGM